jgi:hypothetical protein
MRGYQDMASFEIVEYRASGKAFSKRSPGKSMLVQNSNRHGGKKETG